MEKKIGFIGFGSMGSMLAEMLLAKGAARAESMFLNTRSLEKLESFRKQWPGIEICQSCSDVARQADILFLCVKAMDFREIIPQIEPHMTLQKHLISIAGVVGIEQLEAGLACQVTKLIPSITSLAGDGISLVAHGSRVTRESKAFLDAILGKISQVIHVSEQQIPLATELTSCGPGLYASILQEMALESVKHDSGLSLRQAQDMIARTMLGTMKLVLEKGMGFEEIITRVATKGGITEEGVKVFQSALPRVFEEMFRATLTKKSINEEKAHHVFERQG